MIFSAVMWMVAAVGSEALVLLQRHVESSWDIEAEGQEEVSQFWSHSQAWSCTYWELCNGKQPVDFHSNLAGQGPDSGDAEFRLKGITEVGGTKLDLVVSVAGGETYQSMNQAQKKSSKGAYVSPTSEPVGMNKVKELEGPPCFGGIPLKVNTSTKFNWKFVDPTTSQVVVLDRVELVFSELDRENDDWNCPNCVGPDNEVVRLDTPPSDVHASASVQQKSVNGKTVIQSTQAGGEKNNMAVTRQDNCVPSATNPYQCATTTQLARSFYATYRNTGTWDITLAHVLPNGANSRGDRLFQFYGRTCTTTTTTTTAGAACEGKGDMVVVVDGSGSVSQYGWDLSVQATVALFDMVDANTAMATVVFSKTSEVLTGLTHDAGKLTTAMQQKQWPTGGTATSEGLRQAREELQSKGRPDAEKVIIVITDGQPTVAHGTWDTSPGYSVSKQLTDDEVAKCKALGYKIIMVPVGSSIPMADVQRWASSPELVIQASNFNTLVTTVVAEVQKAACSKPVTCSFTIDNEPTHVYYDGKDIMGTMVKSNAAETRNIMGWDVAKNVTFNTAKGGILAIGGYNYENQYGAATCNTGGLSIRCSSTAPAWNGWVASTTSMRSMGLQSAIAAATGANDWYKNNFDDTTWNAPCVSKSAYQFRFGDLTNPPPKIWGADKYSYFRTV